MRLPPILSLSALLLSAIPASAHGLHPENMNDCVAAEAHLILDAVAATPGARALTPDVLARAYGESFSNCALEEDVSIWQGCFTSDTPQQCLTEMADVAAAHIRMERAAGHILESEHGQTGATDSFAASEVAIAAHAEGIGGAARQNCEANPPEGIGTELIAQACRILFELGQYATWRGGAMLWDGLQDLPERGDAPAHSLTISQACLRDNLAAAQAASANVDAADPLGAARGAVAFVGCSNAPELLPACGMDARGLDACLQGLWRATRAQRIAAGLAAQESSPDAMTGALSLTGAMQDHVMSRCLGGSNVRRLSPSTGWAYCATSINGMQMAMYQGLSLMAAQTP